MLLITFVYYATRLSKFFRTSPVIKKRRPEILPKKLDVTPFTSATLVPSGTAVALAVRPSQISSVLMNKTNNLDGPHMCPYCGKGWRTKSALEMHIRVHTGEEPFICPICGKGHKQKGQLKVKTFSLN